MFDKFQPKTDQEWIEQANRETHKFDSISFPYTFQLESLKLSAINTNASEDSKQLVEYTISKESAHSLTSLMLAEQCGEIEFERMFKLGLEDIFLTLDQAQNDQFIGKVDSSSDLQSVAITYDYGDSKRIVPFIESFVKENRLSLTLYNSSAVNPESGLSSQQIADLTSLINKHNNNIQLLGIRGDILGNRGATAVQELAASLSLLVAQWDSLTKQGVLITSLVSQTELALSTSGEFYFDIVKFKAARILVYYILDAYELANTDPYQIKIRAISGTLNKSLYDPDANLLRNTVESLAAIVGEANIISLRSHDYRYRQPTEFGSRMAANSQHLLRYEGGLHETKNPVDGSYFFEKSIDDMVKQAWQLFLKIEEGGGYYQSGLTDATQHFHPNIRKKEQELLQQKKAVVGVTRYVNVQEKITNDQAVDYQNTPSLMGHWENIRRRVDDLSEEQKPSVAILSHLSTDNLTVRKEITFVIDTLTTLGLHNITVENSLEAILRKWLPDILIFCGDDAWYESHLADTTDRNEIASVLKVAVGQMPLLTELRQKKMLGAVIHAQADLAPLLNVIKQVIP